MTRFLPSYLEKSSPTAITTFPWNTKKTRVLLSSSLHIPNAAIWLSALLKTLTLRFSLKRILIRGFWHFWKPTLRCVGRFSFFFIAYLFLKIYRKWRRNFRRQLTISLRVNLNFEWCFPGCTFALICCAILYIMCLYFMSLTPMLCSYVTYSTIFYVVYYIDSKFNLIQRNFITCTWCVAYLNTSNSYFPQHAFFVP